MLSLPLIVVQTLTRVSSTKVLAPKLSPSRDTENGLLLTGTC